MTFTIELNNDRFAMVYASLSGMYSVTTFQWSNELDDYIQVDRIRTDDYRWYLGLEE